MKRILTFLIAMVFSSITWGQSMANYTFSTNTSGSLDPMIGATSLAGTGTLVTGYNDDYASAVTNIGFDFYFMGVKYTQFSINSNGQMRLGATTVGGSAISSFSSNVPLIVPMAGDNSTGLTGNTDPISYIVTGTAPNRILIIQWKNFQIPYNSSGTIAGNMQAWLYETTGKIDMVYGAMYNNATSATTRSTFIASSNTATTAGYVTVSATPTFTLAASPITNSFAASSNIANLYSATDGSRRVFSFIPTSTTPADPTTLTFTAISASTITPNWVDNSTNETYYIITRATDATFTQNIAITTIASTSSATTGTAYNLAQTGLVPGTLYYYKIQAANEASAPSVGLTGSQLTNAPGTITSIASGNWSDPATWSTGVVPTATDNVTIADGHTVNIDIIAPTCLDLTVGQGVSGILTFTSAAASTLTVNGSITVAVGGDFNAGTTATIIHKIYIGGNTATSPYASNLTVNGSFDMWATATTGLATITFFGTQNSVISGTGATLDFNNTNILNKGATTATSTVTPPVLDLQRAYTVQGGTTLGFIATHTAGTLKISGAFTQSNPVYTAAAYSIPANGGIWLNNANFTISGLTGSPTNNGLFRVTTGTYNIGTGTGNSLQSGVGSVYIIEGGAINVTGRFQLSSSGVYYNQSNGTLAVATIGNGSGSYASFDISSATGTSFIMSGGTIILTQRCTGTNIRDYYVLASPTITGGTLQVGSAATATNFNFRLHGYTPNLIIDNTTNNKKVEVYQTAGQLIVFGDLTVNPGTTFDCLGFIAGVKGNVINSGIIQGLTAGSRFDFQGTTPQTYSGTGTFGTAIAPFIGTGVGISNASNVTLNSPIITTRVNLFTGSFINSNQFTLGIGGTSSVYVQRGGATAAAGSFDVAPIFNIGSGGITVNYTTATTATTSSYEIPVSRALTSMIINNTNGVTLSGGSLTLGPTGTLTLTLGNLTTSPTNLLTLTNPSSTAISGGSATSFVNGPMERTYAASLNATGTYTTASIFPIGYQASYLPIYIDPTTTAGGAVVIKGQAFNTNLGTMGAGVTSLSSDRWEALITAGGANLTSIFLRIGDASILSSNQILQSSGAAGVYGAIPSTSTYAAGTPNTLTTTGTQIPAASFNGYFAYGDLTPCTAPSDQPTALLTSNMTSSSFTGTFTAATSLPSHYLIVRYATGASPTNPVNFTTYVAGGTLGTGTIVASTSTNTFNQTGLVAGTTYDYYIYSFNNSGCYGPVYNSVSPLLTSVTTCATVIGAPGTPTASLVLTTSLTATWAASSTAGVDYYLDVATNNTFTSFVSGYNNKNEGTSLTDNITGLSVNTTYYVRVRALSVTCYSAYSSTLTVTTACNAITVFPFTESFSATLGCWASSEAVAGASYHWVTTVSDATHGVAAPQSGTYFAMLNVYSASTTYNPYYLKSQSFTLDATPKQVKYYYWLGSGGYQLTPVPLALDISTDGGSTWTNLYQHTSSNSVFTATSSTAGWTLNTINLSTYVGQTVQFRFVSNSNYGSGFTNQGIDEFQIEDAPTCVNPTALNTTSLTSTSATINWTASISAPTGGYEYEVRTSGAAGSGATGLITSGSTAAGIVTANISGLTANTNYSFYVRSNCGSGIFSSWTSAGTFYTGYCSPAPSSVDGSGITNVTFSTVNNTTSTETNNYGDYSAMIGNVTQGVTIPVSITFETGYTYDTKIWIDWNNDLDFLDAGEEVYTGTSTSTNPTTLAASFIVPGTATLGIHRMRIGSADSGPVTPCYTGSYASFEDYSVNVIAPVLPVITSLGSTNGCVGTSLIIIGTDLAGATAVTIGGTSAAITANTATTVTVTVGNGTTGTVSVTTIGGTATSSETFTVNQLPALFTVAGGGAYCSGGSGVTITLSGSEIGVDYALSTSPATIMAGTGSALTFGPSAFATGNYTITATNTTTTCSIAMTGNANITVSPIPTAVIVTPATTTICEGTIQSLVASGGTIGATGTIEIGNATTLTGAATQPTAFCNRWKQYWCQMVFTAAELQTAGLTAGNITSLTFNITTLGDAPNVTDFRVSLGTIGTATLSAFTTTGLTQVFGPSTYSQTVGTNLITFATPYTWDGVSNILVDLRQTGADAINNAITYYTATTGNTVVTAATSSASPDLSTTNPTAVTSTQRLNTVFGYTNVTPTTITWTPTTELYTDASATIAYTGTAATTVYAKPTSNATYTATATSGATCTNSGTSVITVNQLPIVALGTDTSLCANQSILLDAGSGYSNYAWSNGATTQTITVDTVGIGTGTFTYYVDVTNGVCSLVTDTVKLTFTICTGINEMNNEINVQVIPNPSNGIINLSISGANGKADLAIYSLHGQLLYTEQLNVTGSFTHQLNMSTLPKGIYIVKLSNENTSSINKMIIE